MKNFKKDYKQIHKKMRVNLRVQFGCTKEESSPLTGGPLTNTMLSGDAAGRLLPSSALVTWPVGPAHLPPGLVTTYVTLKRSGCALASLSNLSCVQEKRGSAAGARPADQGTGGAAEENRVRMGRA